MRENLLSSLSEETNREMEKEGKPHSFPEKKAESVRRDFLAEDFKDKIPNIYEAIIVMSQRARQLGRKQTRIIEQFIAAKARPDTDEEEDEEPVRSFIDEDDEDAPKLPKFEKPTILAMNAMHEGLINYEIQE